MSDTSDIPRIVIIVCRHCARPIENDPEDGWVDPEATGDDSLWRETCDENHHTLAAKHEPFPQTEEDALICVHRRQIWVGNECGDCEVSGYTWHLCDRHDGNWGEDSTCERCKYESGLTRPLTDKGPLGPGEEKPVTRHNIILHTDAPLDMLAFVVAEHGMVGSGTAIGHGGPDCVYGWGEPWDPEKVCKPHHLVYDLEPSMVTVLAQMIVTFGKYQVCVTDRADWSIKRDGFPESYDWAHAH